MAKIKTIEDESNEIIYPVTSSKAVYHNGQLASEILDEVCVDGVNGIKIPKVFVDLWNNRAGSYGKFNTETGYFELNGILNLSYTEAQGIYNWYTPTCTGAQGMESRFANFYERTNFTILGNSPMCNCSNMFRNARCTVIRIVNNTSTNNVSYMFGQCGSLTEVIGTIKLWSNTSTNTMFAYCPKLVEVRVSGVNQSCDFATHPNHTSTFSRETIRFMIDNAVNTNAITMKIMSEVYDRLTQEDLEAATAKNITIVTPE